MKRSILLFTILFSCCINLLAQRDVVLSEKIQSEEYQIYRTVLKELFIKPTTKQLVIRNFTSNISVPDSSSSNTILLAPGRENAPMAQETFDNYKSINQKPNKLQDKFVLDIPVTLITDKEFRLILNKLDEDPGESATRNKFKEYMEQRYKTKYIITLSNVGFNKDRNQALLHVEHMCGVLCGRGEYIFLQKGATGWIIKRKLPTWVS